VSGNWVASEWQLSCVSLLRITVQTNAVVVIGL